MRLTSYKFASALSILLCLAPTASDAQPPVSDVAACGTKSCRTVPARTESSRSDAGVDLFKQALRRIREAYVDPVDEQRLIEAAIEGMVQSLDKHSRYLGSERLEAARTRLRGEFGGLGIRVAEENGMIKVVSPSEGAPAWRAGILPGDIITHLDGHPLVDVQLSEAVAQIRGPLGTQVAMTIRREGVPEPFEFLLTREAIKLHPVRYRTEGRIGYIRVDRFDKQTQPGLEEAVNAIEAALGDSLIGYVLDLRGNPGGLLNQAIQVSDAFLDAGAIVSTRGRRPGSTRHFDAKPGDLADGLPIVVLINGGSASASEIVAAALQDHHRATVLGSQSYGKGTVQSTLSLRNDGAIRITTARYYTPAGRSIHGTGITPDIEVAQAEKAESKAEDGDNPSEAASTDQQLARAIDLLCGIETSHEVDIRGIQPAHPLKQESRIEAEGRTVKAQSVADRRHGNGNAPCAAPGQIGIVSLQPDV